MPIGGHDNVVLDADADALEAIGSVFGLAPEVEAWLDGEYHSLLQDDGVLTVLVDPGVVNVEAEPVRGAVHVVRLVLLLLNDVVHVAVKDAEVEQAMYQDIPRRLVDLGELHARRDDGNGLFLGGEHDVVDVALLRGELAAGGPRAGDIRAVVIDLRPGVDEQQVAVPYLVAVRNVVQDARVPAGRDDGRVAVSGRPQPPELVLKCRLDVVLPEAGPGHSNRLVETACGYVDCALESLDLPVGLDDPHRPDCRHRIHDATEVAAVALPARTTPDDQVCDETVEPTVGAERVVDGVGLGKEFRELLVKLFDGECLVGSQQCRRAVHPYALADPYLVLGIERVDEEDVRLIRAGSEDGDGVRLVEAGEVPEGRVLPVLVLDIVIAVGEVPCGEDDRPIVERLRQPRATRRDVFLGD